MVQLYFLAKPSLKSFQVLHTIPSGAEQPVFIIALIIVFGLVPSLVVLALLLSVNPIPHGLQLAQACIFALGIIVFFLFGVNGHARFGMEVDN